MDWWVGNLVWKGREGGSEGRLFEVLHVIASYHLFLDHTFSPTAAVNDGDCDGREDSTCSYRRLSDLERFGSVCFRLLMYADGM